MGPPTAVRGRQRGYGIGITAGKLAAIAARLSIKLAVGRCAFLDWQGYVWSQRSREDGLRNGLVRVATHKRGRLGQSGVCTDTPQQTSCAHAGHPKGTVSARK